MKDAHGRIPGFRIPAALVGIGVLLIHLLPARAQAPVEKIFKAKTRIAERCRSRAAMNLGKRCFFMAKEYTDLGFRFHPGNAKLERLVKTLAFVTPLPVHLGTFTRDTLPKTEALEKKKHHRSEDADRLNAFFSRDLDSLLCTFIDALASLKEEPAVGREIVILLAHARRMRWMGRIRRKGCSIERFLKKAEVVLQKLGYEKRPISPKSPVERWMSPEEIRLAEAKADFREEKAKVVEKKFAGLSREVDFELVMKPSPFETGLGIMLKKFRSRHFLVEAPFSEEEIKTCLAVQEAGFAEFLSRFQLEDPGRYDPPVKSVILGSKDLYKRYVMEMTSRKDKAFVAQRTGSTYDMTRGYWVSSWAKFDAFLRDNLIACPSIFFLSKFGYKKLPMWVKQGLQAHLCLAVLGSADTSYASSKETTGK
ncbi:MAG: hypothetical protein ACYTHN_20890, partial [Planctomycetota bacterium]